MQAKKRGYYGESLAAHFLKSKGYKILKSNYVIAGGEIDLIARKDGTLAFVEVKTRIGEAYGEGGESINGLKKRHLLRAINRYLSDNNLSDDTDVRIDVIEIEMGSSGEVKNITHFEDLEV